MNKVVSFKKEIIFKTNIDEITSIALEHSIKPFDGQLISGSFLVNGEYRITDTSLNTEVFHYELPFDITLDEKYCLDDVCVDIDDFYYEIVNENVLAIYIEVVIDGLKEREIIEEHIVSQDFVVDHILDDMEEDMGILDDVDEDILEERDEDMDEVKEEVKKKDMVSNMSIFDMVGDKETYMTYKVYIIRDGDSIEGVMQRYGVTREELGFYNDLNDVKIGDKLIIPSIYHEQN